MVGVVATILSVLVTMGVVLGTISGWRVGIRGREMWRSARAWYITWIVLILLACVL